MVELVKEAPYQPSVLEQTSGENLHRRESKLFLRVIRYIDGWIRSFFVVLFEL